MSKRLCILTGYIPNSTSKYGVFKRLGVFLKAFAGIVEIDFLFFPGKIRMESNDFYRQIIKDLWGIDASIVCAVEHADYVRSVTKEDGRRNPVEKLLSVLNSYFSISKQERYINICGKNQLAGLEGYLREYQPDYLFVHRLPPMAAIMSSCYLPMPPIYFDLDDIEHSVHFIELRGSTDWLKVFCKCLRLYLANLKPSSLHKSPLFVPMRTEIICRNFIEQSVF